MGIKFQIELNLNYKWPRSFTMAPYPQVVLGVGLFHSIAKGKLAPLNVMF